MAKFVPQEELSLVDQVRIRREKLAQLQNDGKNPFEQVRIVKEVLNSCKYSEDIKKMVKGFMIESYIEDGRQEIGDGVYGKSITDACLGWEKTEALVLHMADRL